MKVLMTLLVKSHDPPSSEPTKLEHGLRLIRAGIPSTYLH